MILDLSSTKAAWALIGLYYAEQMEKAEKYNEEDESDFGSWGVESRSILDSIQHLYRNTFITEAGRDEMRQHVNEWMGESHHYGSRAEYSCGMWAPSVGPMGVAEHAIILMTVQILEEEAV